MSTNTTYTKTIASIWDKHPTLPRKLGLIRIDQAIAVGDPVDDGDHMKASALVRYLEAVRGELEVLVRR